MLPRDPPKGTEAHAPDHVVETVEDEQAQQQVEEHGLLERVTDSVHNTTQPFQR